MNPLMLRGRHEALGGSLAESGAAEVVNHYGSGEIDEYRAVRQAAGIIERSDLKVARLWGRDPVRMLNGLITNDLTRAGGEQAVYAAMLTPKGRMITDLRAFIREDPDRTDVLIVFPTVATDPLTGHLTKFIPPLFARWEIINDVAVIGVYGPAAAKIVSTLLNAPVSSEEDRVGQGNYGGEGIIAISARDAGGEEGHDLVVGQGALPAVWDELLRLGQAEEVRPLGMAALETLRIEAGRPRFGKDMDDDTIPAEAYETTGLLRRAISFSKGCYTGQEVVVRIAHRGHVNRHLRGLLLGDSPTPAEGSALVRIGDGKVVGSVTSAAWSPLLEQSIALGYLRREVEPGAIVRVGVDEAGPAAVVVDLPFKSPRS